MATPPFVVFGYGSLIFKPPPHVISQVPGFLKGYVRRFAQKSHDHRGTPENPGRVVTLVHKEDWDRFSASDAFPHEDVVWGVAYTINPAYVAEVRDYLDYREKDGYTLETLDLYTIDDGVESVIIHGVRPLPPMFTVCHDTPMTYLSPGICMYPRWLPIGVDVQRDDSNVTSFLHPAVLRRPTRQPFLHRF
jgi:hypothetical protein